MSEVEVKTMFYKIIVFNLIFNQMRKLSLLFLISVLFYGCMTAQEEKVKLGIEVLRDNNFDLLKDKRVGLVTNPTGVDSNLKSTIDILHEAENVQLVALYGPEHGVRGDYSAGDHVESNKDPYTNLPVHSLYGKTRKPSNEMLEGIDVIVYDIQDIGCRSYTYISTMGLVMEAATENGIEVVVLDRPNPVTGNKVEGPLVEDGYISFVSQFKIPYVYGLTCGELARMLNNEKMLKDGKKCKLTVVPMEGWKREMTWEDTGLEWVPTSPHIPHKVSPFFYAVSGIIGELDPNLVGIGYTLPFQTFTTEWLNGHELAKKMNALNLPGVIFRPISFKPYYMGLKGKELHGVQVHIVDFNAVELTTMQFYFLQVCHEMHPDIDLFKMAPTRLSMFDKVTGSVKVRESITKNYKFEDLKEFWTKDAEAFRKKSSKYYLYK